jgi:hypothetical protein
MIDLLIKNGAKDVNLNWQIYCNDDDNNKVLLTEKYSNFQENIDHVKKSL